MYIFDTQRLNGGCVFSRQRYVVGVPLMNGELTPFGIGVIQFGVQWLAATVKEGVIERYEISINGGAYLQIGQQTTYVFEWLPPASTHTVSVRAYGLGGYSNVLSRAVTTDALPISTTRRLFINGRVSGDASETTMVGMFPRV